MVGHFFTNRLVLAFFIVAYHLKFWTCLEMLKALVHTILSNHSQRLDTQLPVRWLCMRGDYRQNQVSIYIMLFAHAVFNIFTVVLDTTNCI